MQWIGIVLMIVALILIIVDAGLLTPAVIAASPTSGAHQIVGILVAVMAISQPVFACCRNGIGNVVSRSFGCYDVECDVNVLLHSCLCC